MHPASKFSLSILSFGVLLLACNTKISKESAWIRPLDQKIDLESLRFSNSEILSIASSAEGLFPFYTMENEGRGDERTNWQNRLYYTSLGFSDFLGEATTTYYEVPFRNEFALSLKVGAMLWDKDRKRSREFLPLSSHQARLLFVANPSHVNKGKNLEIQGNWEFPMIWDNRQDAFSYEALLTPKELNKLLLIFDSSPEGRLFLSINERNYDATGLKDHLIADINKIRQNINARNALSLGNLQALSATVSGRKKFTSPWMSIGKFYVKVQGIYTATTNSASRLELILGSFNPTLLRSAFTGNASLIFSTENEVFFLPFDKLSFFNTLQQKQSSLLSFATTPSSQRDFFEALNWTKETKEFWQINLSSQVISAEELATIKSILDDSTHTVSLSLTEDLLFSGKGAVNFMQHLLSLIYSLKTGEGEKALEDKKEENI